MKNDNRGISKKYLVKLGMKRITNSSNDRVWLFKGKEYNSLRAVVDSLKIKVEKEISNENEKLSE